MYNIKPSNRAVLAAVIDPDLLTAAAHSSGWVDLSNFAYIQAIVAWGTLGASATVNAKLEQATDSSGTGAKDVTGKAITEVDGTDSPIPNDKQAIINCRADELDVDNNFTHVRLTITVATASSDGGGFILGHDARYEPADDVATVAEVV